MHTDIGVSIKSHIGSRSVLSPLYDTRKSPISQPVLRTQASEGSKLIFQEMGQDSQPFSGKASVGCSSLSWKQALGNEAQSTVFAFHHHCPSHAHIYLDWALGGGGQFLGLDLASLVFFVKTPCKNIPIPLQQNYFLFPKKTSIFFLFCRQRVEGHCIGESSALAGKWVPWV